MPKYGAEFVAPGHAKPVMFEFAECDRQCIPLDLPGAPVGVRRDPVPQRRPQGRAGDRGLPRHRRRISPRRCDGDRAGGHAAANGPGGRDSWSTHPAATPFSPAASVSRSAAASTTARPSTGTSPAQRGCPAGRKATSPSSGSITAGSGSYRSPTAPPASARCAGRIT